MKKDVLLTYPAIFTHEDNQYWVEFVDLKGCFSDGKTLAEAIENAKEAMGLYLEDLEEYPKCTTDIKNIKLEDNQIISFVTINLDDHKRKYENKSVKKTLSIPAWLNNIGIERQLNFSKILTDAIIKEIKNI